MKKLIFATLIMTIMLSFSALAGWSNEENGWKYYNNDGTEVVNDWKRSGDNWYYLGGQGYMLTDSLVWNDDNTFSFVDETGARVGNVWICRTDEEYCLDQNWLYIKANGKSVNSGWYTINGQRYHFTDNKMDYGYLDNSGSMTENWQDAEYNLGTADEGWVHTGWVKEYNTDGDLVWLYFGTKKKVDGTYVIDGKKYCFDADGAMISGDVATSSEKTKYFGSDGALVKDAWIQRTDADGETYWQYAKMSGELMADGEHKINGKYYYFDGTIMQTGWNNNKYYGSDGARVSGKKTINEKDYYFESNGKVRYGVCKGYYYGETDENSNAEECYLRTSEDAQYRIENNDKLIRFDGKVCTAKQKYYDSWNDKYYIIDDLGVHACNSKGEY